MSIPIYLAFSVEEAAAAGASGYALACMGYQLAQDTQALLAPDPLPALPCHMLLQDNVLPSYLPTPELAQVVARYAAACHTGLICDFDRPVSMALETLVRDLDQACVRLKLPLWVPRTYAHAAPHSWVMIPSDCCRGAFASMLREAATAYPGRCVLELRPMCRRMPLPCPGAGISLTPEERRSILAASGAPVFYSRDLCCNYFSFPEQGGIQLVVFETRSTVKLRLQAAEAAGFQAAIGLMQELAIQLPEEP